ncbi:MAG: outer membrane beta-barrel protein [Bacteroidota bacterium]
MKTLFLLLLIGIPFVSQSQNEAGQFSLGMRSTLSLFGDHGKTGIGTGGQFRIRVHKNINTDWFTDYITTDIAGLARRHDYHIGWSVLFYPTKNPIQEKKITPYFIAGHCFDYTEVQANAGIVVNNFTKASRWSSAVQGGIGAHYNITEAFDVSLTTQYMLHLGKEIDAHTHTNSAGVEELFIEEAAHQGLEGHLLTTLSMNYKIANLWNRKK